MQDGGPTSAGGVRPVSAQYVHSRVTKYHPVLVDLRWCRAIHSCDACPYKAPSTPQGALQCNAVHYGICTSVRLARVGNGPKSRHQQTLHIITQAVKEREAAAAAQRASGAGDVGGSTVTSGKGHPTTNDYAPGDSFLRQKEAQLKAKREQEARKQEVKKETTKPTPEPHPVTTSEVTVKNKPEANVVKRTKDGPVQNIQRQASVGSTSSVHIPEFYFPGGQTNATDENEAVILQRLKEEFGKIDNGKVDKSHMGPVCKACGFPTYMKLPLFSYVGGEKSGHVTLQTFLAAWRKLRLTCHDEASQFLRLLARAGHNYLEEEDFRPLVQDIVDCHPGLTFLQDAPEFHSRYVQTVISRIFYCVNRSWSGRITVQEIRKSNLLETLHHLEEEEDINQVMDYFSYEHFYVIYCKFWELDKDHDLFISKDDLARHADHAISSKMIERIFSGAVTRNLVDGKMSYRDFVWFLISEEDKRHPTSIEYWFRCMDLDGDGVISMYEMEYFYEEQVQKMESLGIETLPFEDCVCQMLDMVRPRYERQITLMDLKACQMTPVFFDTFFNLDKYLEHEQKDPFANIRDLDGDEPEMSDWERYAADEYEILVAEEGANELQNEELMYEDDFEPEDDEVLEPVNLADPPQKKISRAKTDDDIYDFSKQDLGY